MPNEQYYIMTYIIESSIVHIIDLVFLNITLIIGQELNTQGMKVLMEYFTFDNIDIREE